MTQEEFDLIKSIENVEDMIKRYDSDPVVVSEFSMEKLEQTLDAMKSDLRKIQAAIMKAHWEKNFETHD